MTTTIETAKPGYVRDFVDETGRTVKMRVYQTEAQRGTDWFHIGQKVYSAAGELIAFEGGLSGTREYLGLTQREVEGALFVKKAPY